MKINEIKKKDGSTVYRANIYLGVDVITGKKVTTKVTARTKKELKTKAQQAQFDFKANEIVREKLRKCIWRYAFIFEKGNLFDLCDWFPLFSEYGLTLSSELEENIVERIRALDNPILWGIILR